MDPKTARRVFIGGAAFLAVVVLGVAVQLNRRGPAEGTQGIQLSAPIPPRPESEVDDEDAERAPTDRLLVAKAPGDGDDVTFTEMLGLLKDGPRSAKTQAVADKFAADFKAQPRLKAVYDDYKRDAAAGKKPTAAAFMAKLRGTEGFKELVTRFAGMPGSGALMLQIAKQPRMETFLREDSARILGKPVARGRAAATLRGAGAI
ncbi:MAG: hypothetical protein HY553_14560, partial [Elusimicrobia bacterium]|nr:hypothetical protein [Elusimicrobiota bacterium]